MKKIKLVILAMSLFVGLAACAKADTEATKESTSGQTEEVVLPKEDRGGNAISLPEKVTKIVSLAPSMTQVIEDLNRGNQLLAIDAQSATLFPDMADLPQFDMMAVDAEKLIALQPQVVYITDVNEAASENIWKQVADAGITVVSIPTSTSIKDIELDVQFIADSLSETKRGEALVETMKKDIDEVRTIGEKITDKKTVLFEISGLPEIYSFGKGTFLNEMIEMIGAENVFSKEDGWIPVTEEAAIASKPDVILTSVNYMDNPVNEILNRKGWEQVPAIKEKAVYEVDNASSSLPNHHIVKALKQMAKEIYPEEYKEVVNE
ncbi:iron complex transport system substrate-binding protein [Enterococcus sp. AZ194]|uniref:ABC transporter substrate-binding protein n=1 Tax=Enterococcus sp. AZ194 TaxID=2774629 RepID=UPI003F2270AC